MAHIHFKKFHAFSFFFSSSVALLCLLSLRCSNVTLDWVNPGLTIARGKTITLVSSSFRDQVDTLTQSETEGEVGTLTLGATGTFSATSAATATTTVTINYKNGGTTSLPITVHGPGLDTSFNVSGTQTIAFEFPGVSNADEAKSLAIQSDGKIVLTGFAEDDGDADSYFAVARLNTDGSLDNGFGDDGKQSFQIAGAGTANIAYSVALTPSGKILLAGEADGRFGAAILTASGSVESSFQGDTNNQLLASLLPFDDTSYFALGRSTNIAKLLLRFSGDLNLDTVDQEIANGELHNGWATARSGDKLLVAGEILGNFLVARYEEDGDQDPSFFTQSGTPVNYQTVDSGGGGADTAYALAVQSDGKIVLAGELNGKFGLVRVSPEGSGAANDLDLSFGGDGMVIITNSTASYKGVALLDNGNIVVGGANTVPTSALAVYLADGSGYYIPTSAATILDPEPLAGPFPSGGLIETNSAFNTVAIDNVGRIVAAGYRTEAGNSDFLVVRYWP